MTRTKADELADKANWWRPIYPEYGFRIVVPWYTYNEGTHVVIARTVDQALGMFRSLVEMSEASRRVHGLPEVATAYAGTLVYPPAAYFEAFTVQRVKQDVDAFRHWVNSLFDTLVASKLPLPTGVSACTKGEVLGEDSRDTYSYHEEDCACGGNKYVGYDYEGEFYDGGRERNDEYYIRRSGKHYQAPKTPNPYDSTISHVRRYDPSGPQLYAIGDGNKGLGVHAITEESLRGFREGWVPSYTAFFQGGEVPVPEPIKSFIDDKRVNEKRDSEERDRERERIFEKDKEQDVIDAVEFFKKPSPLSAT